MSRIIFFVLLIKTMFWSSDLNAQVYQTLSIDGFNQDVIADGIGTAASSTTSDVDGVSFSFKSINWMLTSTSSPQTKGFPVDGIINSEATMGLKYQLKDYRDSNSIQLNGSSSSIISNVSGSVKAKKLFMLVTSGSGSSNLTCKVTFEDNSAMVFLNIFISDWYSGTLPAVAFHDFGRIGRMNNVVENPASNPRLYEATIDISNIYQNKSIKSIQFVREPNSSGVVNIFAVSAQKYIDCDNPLAVTISDIIGATAKVNLVLPSVLPLLGYEYEVRTSGVPGSGAVGLVSTGTISFDATTHKLTGLPPIKQLYFYIRSNCGAKGVQDWMGPISFLTNCEIPKIISTSSQNACKNSSAYLSANYNSGIVRWYDSPTSEIPLAVGNSFATPNLSSSKSYWVEAMASEFLNSSGGKTDLHSSANDINTFKDWGIIFDLNQDVILKSTDVFVGNYGTLNIAIRDNQGKELFSTGDISVNTADINKRVTIPLKFKLAAGTGYRMVIKSFSDITLYRDSPVSFPYKEDNGIMTVTSGFFDGFTRDHYYYFYNIIYEKECISPRTEVIANVIDIAAPIANTPAQTFCASSDPTLNSIGIQGSGIQWYATETGSVALPHTTLLEDNTTYYASQTIGTCTSETRTAVKVELKKPTLNVAGLQSDFYYGTDTQSIMTMIDSLLGNYPLTWFRDEIGGNSIPAPDIATLNVGQYLYLISANINGCESHRIKVVLNAMPAELTVSVNAGQTKLYGNVDPELTYTVSGLKNNEQASNVLTGTLSRDIGENVGDYVIQKGSLAANNNYNFVFESKDFTITKTMLTITVNEDQSKVYGDIDPVLTYTVSGLKNSDTTAVLTGVLSRDAGENSGAYAINQGSLITNANYEIHFVTGLFTIIKATLNVKVDANQTKVYGDADPVFGYTASGYKYGDTDAILTGVLSRVAGEGVNIYAINQGTLSAGGNYNIVFTGKDFEITKAMLMVMATANQTKVYGDADPAFGYTVSGFKNGDVATVLIGALSRVAGENVSTYAINQGSLSSGANYNITFNSADFEITKAMLTVTTDANQSKIYGETDPVFGYTVSGYKNGDTAAVLTGVLIRDTGENVGTYAINQGSLTVKGNYDLTFLGADFEITKATVQGILLNDATFGYDGTAKSLDIVGVLPTGTSVTYQNNSHVNLGSYTVKAIINGGVNYFDLVLDAVLTIEKGTINGVSFSNVGYTYDGTLKSLAIKGTLPVGTGVSYVNNGHIDAGDYSVTALIDGGVNYNDLTLKAILTIRKAPITGITFDNASFVYDGSVKSLAIKGALPTGASVTYQDNHKIDAGSYTVTASINGGENYTSLRLTALLMIEKANQTINFSLPSPVTLEDVVDYQLNASATSGLKVDYTYSYNTITPAATVSKTGWLEFEHTGTIQITAQQGGNKNYHAAPSIAKTLVVESRDASIHSLNIDGMDFEKPGDEIIYTMDCNDLKNEVLVEIQTQMGATVEPSHELVISVPNPGIYRKVVSITSQNGQVVKEYVIRIEKPFLFSYIAEQKYDNVLLINNNPKTNGGYKFVKFEWYKNGELIGEKQTYSAGNRSTDVLDKSAEYHAVLTTDSGDVLFVCPTEILLKHQYNTKLYPSPAKAGNSITVAITYPLSQLQGERLDIFDMNGKRIASTTITGENTELVLPSSLQTGTYIATFKLNGQHKVIHFTVE